MKGDKTRAHPPQSRRPSSPPQKKNTCAHRALFQKVWKCHVSCSLLCAGVWHSVEGYRQTNRWSCCSEEDLWRLQKPDRCAGNCIVHLLPLLIGTNVINRASTQVSLSSHQARTCPTHWHVTSPPLLLTLLNGTKTNVLNNFLQKRLQQDGKHQKHWDLCWFVLCSLKRSNDVPVNFFSSERSEKLCFFKSLVTMQTSLSCTMFSKLKMTKTSIWSLNSWVSLHFLCAAHKRFHKVNICNVFLVQIHPFVDELMINPCCRHWSSQCDQEREHFEGCPQTVHHVPTPQSHKVSSFRERNSQGSEGWLSEVSEVVFRW